MRQGGLARHQLDQAPESARTRAKAEIGESLLDGARRRVGLSFGEAERGHSQLIGLRRCLVVDVDQIALTEAPGPNVEVWSANAIEACVGRGGRLVVLEDKRVVTRRDIQHRTGRGRGRAYTLDVQPSTP